MLRSLLAFFLLQLVVWSIVFHEDETTTASLDKSAISATWVNHVLPNDSEPLLHHLTLLENGKYLHKSSDAMIESGEWSLSDSGDRLMFFSNEGRKEYLIIQFPAGHSDRLVIKPVNFARFTSTQSSEYILIREERAGS